MDFSQSRSTNSSGHTSKRPSSEGLVPHGPEPSRRWECPAWYQTNHKHQDGRPLCRYCECWNPAPFPDGNLPVEPVRLPTTCFPVINILDRQLSATKLPPSGPSAVAEHSTLYRNYNLPPMPVSMPDQTLVSNINR